MTVDGIPNHGLGQTSRTIGPRREDVSSTLQPKGVEGEIIAAIASNLPPLKPEDLNTYFELMAELRSYAHHINQRDWFKEDHRFQTEDITTAQRTDHTVEEIRKLIERFPNINYIYLHAIVDFTKELSSEGNIASTILFISRFKNYAPTPSVTPNSFVTKTEFFKALIDHTSKTAHSSFASITLLNVDGSTRDEFCHVPPRTDIDTLCKNAEEVDPELSQVIRNIFDAEKPLSEYNARQLFNGSVVLVNLLKNTDTCFLLNQIYRAQQAFLK